VRRRPALRVAPVGPDRVMRRGSPRIAVVIARRTDYLGEQ